MAVVFFLFLLSGSFIFPFAWCWLIRRIGIIVLILAWHFVPLILAGWFRISFFSGRSFFAFFLAWRHCFFVDGRSFLFFHLIFIFCFFLFIVSFSWFLFSFSFLRFLFSFLHFFFSFQVCFLLFISVVLLLFNIHRLFLFFIRW